MISTLHRYTHRIKSHRRYLMVSVLAAAFLSSCAGPSQKSTTQQSAVNEQRLADASLQSFELPDYKKLQLPNGLTVQLMEQQEVPLIAIRADVRAGSLQQQGRMGLANLTADALLFGAGGRTKTDIQQQLDFYAAKLSTGAHADASQVVLDLAAKDWQQLLPLFVDLVRRPTFDAEELNKHQQRLVAQMEQMREQPRSVLASYFNRLLFQSSPYGDPVLGTQASIKSYSQQDLQNFHHTWYRPDNMVITVVGDFDSKRVLSDLKRAFGDWQVETGAPQLSFEDFPRANPTEPQVVLVDKPDASEATFMIGGPGIRQDNRDRDELEVINTILGGRFTSWLNTELRVNSGLSYGARSGFTPYRYDGRFTIYSFTKTETAEQAIDLALSTYQRLWQQGIDQATLDSAKSYVKGQFPPNFETNGQLANLLADMHLYDFGPEIINDFFAQVDTLSLEQTGVLIEQYFPKDKLQMVVIGQADKLRPFLSKYGQVVEYSIAEDHFGGKRP